MKSYKKNIHFKIYHHSSPAKPIQTLEFKQFTISLYILALNNWSTPAPCCHLHQIETHGTQHKNNVKHHSLMYKVNTFLRKNPNGHLVNTSDSLCHMGYRNRLFSAIKLNDILCVVISSCFTWFSKKRGFHLQKRHILKSWNLRIS